MTSSSSEPKTPAISIVIAAHDTAEYVGATLDSVIRQTFLDFEVLVVDDCSTDDTARVVSEMARRDSRIMLIRLDRNVGAMRARWRGVAAAVGTYLYLMDSDDLLVGDALETCYKAARAHRADLVYFRAETFSSSSPPDTVRLSSSALKEPPGHLVAPADIPAKVGSQSHTLYSRFLRRDLVRGEREFSTQVPYFEELITYAAVIDAASRAVIVDRALYLYRVNRTGQATENWFGSKRTYKRQCLVGVVGSTLSVVAESVALRTLIVRLVRMARSELAGVAQYGDRHSLREEFATFRRALALFDRRTIWSTVWGVRKRPTLAILIVILRFGSARGLAAAVRIYLATKDLRRRPLTSVS